MPNKLRVLENYHFVALLGGGVCDFEDPQICGYTQDRTDDFDWTRQSGRTSSASTEPFADHTYGTKQGKIIMPHPLCMIKPVMEYERAWGS